MKNKLSIIIIVILSVSNVYFILQVKDLNRQSLIYENELKNALPTKYSAAQVGGAILRCIYKERILYNTFSDAKLDNDSIWVIYSDQSEPQIGGGPFISLRKSDCKILEIGFGK